MSKYLVHYKFTANDAFYLDPFKRIEGCDPNNEHYEGEFNTYEIIKLLETDKQLKELKNGKINKYPEEFFYVHKVKEVKIIDVIPMSKIKKSFPRIGTEINFMDIFANGNVFAIIENHIQYPLKPTNIWKIDKTKHSKDCDCQSCKY